MEAQRQAGEPSREARFRRMTRAQQLTASDYTTDPADLKPGGGRPLDELQERLDRLQEVRLRRVFFLAV